MFCIPLAALLVSATVVIMRNKTSLILLPGLLCDETLWAHQTKTLSDAANVTIADMTRDNSIRGMAVRILAGAPKKFSLAGLSMGGYVAQEIMRLEPDRVERLALLHTSARAGTEHQKRKHRRFIEQLGIGGFKEITRKLLPYLIHSDRLHEKALISIVEESAANIGPDAFIRQQTAILSRLDEIKDLANITCPTLLLCGRQDALTPLSEHEEMAKTIPNSHLVIIEDCGHLSPLEKPYAVSAAMRYWLNT